MLEGHEGVKEGEEEKQIGLEEEVEDENEKVLREELQLQKHQKESGLKEAKRTSMIGQLLRSKGYLLHAID